MGIFDKNRTFKPNLNLHMRNVRGGTARFDLHRHAHETLGGQNGLRAAVRLPPGEDEAEWIAVNVVDFFNTINIIYGHVSDECTATSCKTMSAGPKYEFLWADGVKIKRPVKLPANQYVDHLMTWVVDLFENPAVFPPDEDTPFPANFKATAARICSRFFRVFGHIYYSHFGLIVKMGAEAHLNSSFKHFYYFCQEFRLVESRELAPLRALIVNLTNRDRERGFLDESDNAFSMARSRSESHRKQSAAGHAGGSGGVPLSAVASPPAASNAPLCHKCKTPLSGQCPSIESKEFHARCFTCNRCRCSLAGLAEVLLIDDSPYCETCATVAVPGGGPGSAAAAVAATSSAGGAAGGSSGPLALSRSDGAGSGAAGGQSGSGGAGSGASRPPAVVSVHPAVMTVDGTAVTLIVENVVEPVEVIVAGQTVSGGLLDVSMGAGGRAVLEFQAPALAGPGRHSVEVRCGNGRFCRMDNALQYVERAEAPPVVPSPSAGQFPFMDTGPQSDDALQLCRRLTWYWGTMSSGQAEQLLSAHDNGSFFVRYSERSGCPVISWLDSQRRATHSPVRSRGPNGMLGLDGSPLSFSGMDDLLSEHTRTLQYPIHRVARVTANGGGAASPPRRAEPAARGGESSLSPRSAPAPTPASSTSGRGKDSVFATRSKLDVKALRSKFG